MGTENTSAEPLVSYTVKQVCSVLHLSRPTVRKLIKRGRLLIVRAGRRIIVPRESLERFLRDGGKRK